MKKILILMIEVGSGHKIPALAVKDAIEEIAAHRFRIKVVDFAKESGATKVDHFLKSSWNLALTHPVMAKAINRIIDVFYPITHSRNLLTVLFRDFAHKGIEFIRQFNPDIVYSTHFFCSTIAAMAKKKYHLPFEVVTTMTDPFVGHHMWIDNHLDYILAANPVAADYLIRGGMKKEKVRIVPLPIHARFFNETKNKEEIKEQFRLNEKKLTLLFSAGGQGIGKSEEYIKAIYRRDLPVNIIAVCGKNQELFQSLSFLKNKTDTRINLTVLGYVDYMNVLLSIADLFVSKAGPAAVFESLVCGCPIIFTHWVGYNEKGNLDFCIKHEVGWFAPNSEKFLQLLEKIMDQEDLLIRYQKNIENVKATPFIGQLSEGAQQTAEFVLSRLGDSLNGEKTGKERSRIGD